MIGKGRRTRDCVVKWSRDDLAPHPALPNDTRLWAALQQASGGVWGGCVYDVDAVVARLAAGGAQHVIPEQQ